MRLPIMLTFLLWALLAASPCRAGDGGPDGGADDGSVPNDASPPSGAPLACGGDLCDTTNGGECGVGAVGGARFDPSYLAVAAAVLGGFVLRRRKRALAVVVGAGAGLAASPARAEEPPPVDVVIHEAPPPRRYVAVQWNPVSLVTIGKLSADVVIAPADHHALVLSPFYAWSNTAPIVVNDDAGNARQLPEQKFRGFGAEIGYRYYFGLGGPRGFFLGPSFILGSFTATAADGDDTPYASYGVAADIGYAALVADRLALTLGGGVQYTTTSKSIPDQQFPADIYANRLVRPRVLAALGWAF